MKTVIFTVKPIATSHPAGTSGGDWVWHILNQADGSIIEKANTEGTEITRNMPDGSYRVEVVRATADGQAALGSVAAADFVVKDDSVVVDTADAVIVSYATSS